MNKLLDLDTKLTILARNPCACDVCRHAAKTAKSALSVTAPSVSALFKFKEGTPEFAAAEQAFHADEADRLQAVYDIIGKMQCLIASSPPPVTLTPIPDLPAAEEWRDHIEYYRKHAMKPRLREPIKTPRVPGSFTFK